MSVLLLVAALARAGDPFPTGVLERDRFVAAVLDAHPAARAAAAEVRAAEAGVDAASPWMPLRAEVMVAPLSGMPRAELSQMHMAFGEARAERAMGAADREMAEAAAAMTALELADRATRLWVDWYALHAELALVEASAATMAQLEASARERYARGLGPLGDALMAARERAMYETDAVMLAGERRVLLLRINGLLAREAEAYVPPPAPLPDAVSPPAPAAHPEARMAAAAVAEAEAATTMARRARGPAWGWMLGWESGDHVVPEDRLMAGLMVEVPLDRAAGRARVAAGEAAVAAAGARAEAVTLAVDTERAVAATEVAAQAAVVAAVRDRQVPAADAAVAAARADYEAGHDGVAMLLTALHEAHLARVALARARAELHRRAAMATMAAGTLPGGDR